jgi:hypothetical protein
MDIKWFSRKTGDYLFCIQSDAREPSIAMEINAGCQIFHELPAG